MHFMLVAHVRYNSSYTAYTTSLTKALNMSQQILHTAHTRAEQLGLPYAGALTPQEAYDVLQATPDAVLVDVRSQAELDLVGRIPDALGIQWAFYPGMVPNPEFADQLQSKVGKDAIVIFMCRTGGRSHGAASMAQQLGYHNAYNMLEGFEGEANQQKQRTLINGWKHVGLPWTNG